MSDTHGKLIANATGYGSILEETIHAGPADGPEASEALKISHSAFVSISNKVLVGGLEDVVDAVRVTGLRLKQSLLQAGPKTRTFVTVKGGGSAELKQLTLRGKVRWPWHVSLGDWTIYNHNPAQPPMSYVVLDDVRRDNGKRVVVLQLYCRRVITANGRYLVINLYWFSKALFWIWRKLKKYPEEYRERIENVPDYLF